MKITIYEKKEAILMLNIYYGDMKEAVYNTSAYFKYDYEDSWIVDPFVKEMIQKRTILKKKETELLVNGKNTVAVSTRNELKGHGIGSVLAVFYTTVNHLVNVINNSLTGM